MDASTVTITVCDKFTRDFVCCKSGVSSITENVKPGFYVCITQGKTVDGKWVVLEDEFKVSGQKEFVFNWNYNSRSYSTKWYVTDSVYNSWVGNNNIPRFPENDSQRANFCDYTSTEIRALANSLSDLSKSMSADARANFVLKFVQECITYEYDSDSSYKEKEYYKYPIQTLFEKKGDCEDTAILYCSLMKAMGYRSSLLLYLGGQYANNGHCASGVEMSTTYSGTYWTKNNVKYFFCETTVDDGFSSMNVGTPWTMYGEPTSIVVI